MKEDEHYSKLILNAKDLPITDVIVFNDRAEVTRRLKIDVIAGIQEIIVHDFKGDIAVNSFRVTGGSEHITILEMAFEIKSEATKPVEEDINKFIKELESLKDRSQLLAKEKEKILKEIKNIEHLAESYVNPKQLITRNNGENILSEKAIDGLENFIKFYNDRLIALDTNSTKIDQDMEDTSHKTQLLAQKLTATSRDVKLFQDVTILVKSTEKETVEFKLVYLIKGASWKADYDVRIDLDNTIELTYNALIQQETPEDWKNVNIVLSTANPSIGGIPPELTPEKIQFYVERHYFRENNKRFEMKQRSSPRSSAAPTSSRDPDKELKKEEKIISVMTATVEQKSASATSVQFKIERKTTINHNNEPHKVAITIIKLTEGKFKYTIHPSLSQKAYLSAKVKNTSLFPLLPGPTKIFFGNNFNTTSKIEKLASPGERFPINLGTDPAVSVIYKPLHKYKEESGILNKTTIQNYEYETIVKNSKRLKIHIKVRDQLPLSTTDAIKVKLQEPDLRIQQHIELQKDNNLKWKLFVNPGNL